MAEAIDKAMAAVAKRQRGYVTRRQLLHLGLGRQAIDYRLRLGRLIPVYAGVYAVGHVPIGAADRAAGALLACGPEAVLSHGSAASLWGFFKRWELPFEVTTVGDRRPRTIRVHRSTSLTRKDIGHHLGLRVTTPARTILDIAPRLTDKALTRAVNDARLSNYLRLPALGELLERCSRHPGAKRLTPFLQAPSGPTRSEFEDEFLAFTKRFGLPLPNVNATVGGREVDALFEAEKLIVELDGYDYHSSKDAFEGDRERDAEHLLDGYGTVRVTWDRLTGTPRKEATRLHAILARRRRERGPRA
jgi:Transcriptional regulator, AbiEi antitoxin